MIVRSGGGLPGIDVHVGYWLAMQDAGIVGSALHGTSAGAIISALDAIGWTPERAQKEVSALRDDDIRDERTAWKIRLPWLESVMVGAKKRALLARFIPSEVLRPACTLRVWAARMPTGEAKEVNTFGRLVDSICASCAIPVMFPRVALADGREYVDGGIVRNLPLPRDWRDYDRIIVCDATLNDPDPAAWRNRALANGIGAIRMMMRDQFARAKAETAGDKRVTWLQLQGVKDKGVLHFDHSLIIAAQRYAAGVLKV
jgi:predicted acylesterase/phospholipase RssA